MSRTLRVIPAEPRSVLDALRDALAGGSAVLPGAPAGPVPATVPDAVALVVETSGSTAAPKRVALSAEALLASAAASDAALSGRGQERSAQWLLALPVHYIAGLNVLVRSIAAGTEPVILGPGHFEASAFASAASRLESPHRYTSVVPAQLLRLLDAAENDRGILEVLQRFDALLVGGQATPREVVERALALDLAIVRTYGSSETSGGCVYDGVPIGPTRMRVNDGQVELSGPTLAEGYLDDPERTAATFVIDGGTRWYRTGDTGSIADGVLAVTGRLDSVIISGGEKVSLEAIERVIRGLPGLADAVAIRAPSDEWGEVPVVFSSGTTTLAELRAHVVEALGRASAPVAFVRLEEVPQLSSGKPDRVMLTSFAATRGGGAVRGGSPGRAR